MKTLTLLFTVLFALPLWAKKEMHADKFVIHGHIFEINILEGTETEASNTLIVIYQDREIYASFHGDEKGGYEFVLPIGHEYELWYGGKEFVNKKVYVDARSMPKKSSGYECNIDMGLFRPMQNVEFHCLVDHYVKVRFDAEYRQLIPDYEYSEFKAREVEKAMRRAKKASSGF